MSSREERRQKMRSIVANAYSLHHNDRGAFRRQVRQDGVQKLGISPMLIITLISLAIKCYQLWRSLQLSEAPPQPVSGEPEFDLPE